MADMVPDTPNINIRQQNIIRALLNTSGRATLAELSSKTGLNARVIRYNMDVVRSWIQGNKVKFISRPGYGVEVVASQQQKNELLSAINCLEDCDIILSRQQRIRIILLHLLTSDEPVAAKRISELENISRSTIFKDVQEIEAWLQKFKITLKRQTYQGLWIEGKEEARRFALSRLLREELGETKWLQLTDYSLQQKFKNEAISNRVEEFINSLELGFARKLVNYIEDNIGRSMAVKSRVEIMVYLAITIMALKQGKTIKAEAERDILTTDEFIIVQVLGYQIAKQFHLELSGKEFGIIAALLIGSKWDHSQFPLANNSLYTPPCSPKSRHLAQEIVNICSMRLHPMLKIDEELICEIAYHLEYSLFRLKYSIPSRNSNVKEIKDKYPWIYRVVESSTFILEHEISMPIPEEEIGFIAMYLLSGLERLHTVEDSHRTAIIANDGIRAKSSLLKSRLEHEFQNLKVVQIMNNFTWDPSENLDAEIIISTIPLENQPLPVIEVSPFLEIEDIKTIQRWVTDKNQKQRKRNFNDLQQQDTLVDILNLANITFYNNVDSWQEMVKLASQPLIDNHCIQERYADAMIELMDQHGFYMYIGPGVLLLHAKPTDGVNKLCMSLMKLDKPYHFDKVDVPSVDLVFVLGATNDNSHLTALFQLNDLIQSPGFLKELRETKTQSEVILTIWKWFPALPEYQ